MLMLPLPQTRFVLPLLIPLARAKLRAEWVEYDGEALLNREEQERSDDANTWGVTINLITLLV